MSNILEDSFFELEEMKKQVRKLNVLEDYNKHFSYISQLPYILSNQIDNKNLNNTISNLQNLKSDIFKQLESFRMPEFLNKDLSLNSTKIFSDYFFSADNKYCEALDLRINSQISHSSNIFSTISSIRPYCKSAFDFEGAFSFAYESLYKKIPDTYQLRFKSNLFDDEFFIQDKKNESNEYALSQLKDIAGAKQLFNIDEHDIINFIAFLSKTDLGTEHEVGKKIKEDLIQYKKNNLLCLSHNTILFRSRIYHREDEITYLPSQILDIQFGITGQNRFNRPGTVCLYMADNQETAECEIKVSSEMRIATVKAKLKRTLKILDMSEQNNIVFEYCQKPNYEENVSFPRAYIFPNFIASVCCLIGIDGIKYKSSLSNGNCYVFFNIHSDAFENIELL